MWRCGHRCSLVSGALEVAGTTVGDASPEGPKDRFSVITPRAYQRGPGSVKSGRDCLVSLTSLLEAEADGRRGEVTKICTGYS